jgi:CRISPR-associated protein Csb2
MSGLTIGWEYLTGYAVATDPASRERAEWPPHPARVFMALAAAWFQSGEDSDEGDALRWVETLGDPEIRLPSREQVAERSHVTTYVPVNDTTPADFTKNKTYKEIVAASTSDITPDNVESWMKAIDKSAKNAITIPTCLRISLLDRLRSVSNLALFEDIFGKIRVTLTETEVKDFDSDAIGIFPNRRSKQPRTFPRVYVGRSPCFMHWPEAKGVDDHRDALTRLCGKVTRIGHSSSLVRMWVGQNAGRDQTNNARFVVDDINAQFHARQISKGFLTTLIENYGEDPRQREKQLQTQIEALNVERKSIKGKGSTERKAEVDQRIAPLTAELDALVVHAPIRPKVGLWSGYRRADNDASPVEVGHTYFDTDLLVLTQVAGPTLPLVSTLTVTQALRGAVMQHSGVQPVPQWVSGHQPNGERSESQAGHLACVPLPFVGHEHADGHLMGVGLAFPRSVDRHDRGRVLGPVLLEATGEPRSVELTLGRLGVWTLHKSDWSERRTGLQPSTWTAHPDGATTWASVTPVVLDKFPKADRVNAQGAWRDEAAGIIAEACNRIGLPEPEWIDIDTTSWHRGSPRAIAKHRRLRAQSTPDQRTDAPLGGGFPCYPAKGTRAPRVQVHVWLRFAEPVVGPILLGAGRFLGYGLCKPCKENQQ